jgi:hypothetical protein
LVLFRWALLIGWFVIWALPIALRCQPFGPFGGFMSLIISLGVAHCDYFTGCCPLLIYFGLAGLMRFYHSFFGAFGKRMVPSLLLELQCTEDR